jgi:hypothetical protein
MADQTNHSAIPPADTMPAEVDGKRVVSAFWQPHPEPAESPFSTWTVVLEETGWPVPSYQLGRVRLAGPGQPGEPPRWEVIPGSDFEGLDWLRAGLSFARIVALEAIPRDDS